MGDNGASILIFGAGNIGRSFIGQVFARGGWRVTFVDVDRALVDALNEFGSYRVVIRREGAPDDELMVENVRAIDGRDGAAVSRAVAQADCLVSSVGKAALPRILAPIAEGLKLREASARPLDLILAENDREAPETVAAGLEALLPPGFPLHERLGLVETSIGKMVPIMRPEDLAEDRLRVFAEPYNRLIVDGRAFLGGIPALPDLDPVDDIQAFVDRKLFIHNLGHAAVAWFGFRTAPGTEFIAEALALPGVGWQARAAMEQAAEALVLEYPRSFDLPSLEAHIDDLLGRFANRALGDTVFRVGRDLPRKLDRSDRLIGAALLCERRGKPWDAIAALWPAALGFSATGPDGKAWPPDLKFRQELAAKGARTILGTTCRLDPADELDRRVMETLAS
jgi:mannitol-1-phosphate 5-dehydrogenase